MNVDAIVARLDLSDHSIAALEPLLDVEERARADRYRLPILRTRFIAGRAFLRLALADRLEADPRELRFTYGRHGKPELDAPFRFNLSHTDDLALLAIAPHGETGADVERIRPELDHAGLARRYFSDREVAWLMSFPTVDRPAAFFDCWTAKEAYIKARGDGLSFSLQAFCALPREFAVYGDPRESARWTIVRSEVADGVRAAIAAEGSGWRIEMREWQWNRPAEGDSALAGLESSATAS